MVSIQQRETAEDKVIDILLRSKRIGREEVKEARTLAGETKTRIGYVLLDKNFVSDVDLALAQSEYLNMTPVQLARFSPDSMLMELMPKELLKHHLIVPLARSGRMVTIALGDPFDVVGVEKFKDSTGLDVNMVVAPERQVQDMLQRFSTDSSAGLEDILRDVEEGEVELGSDEYEDSSLEEMIEGAEDAPVIRIVNSIMVEAIRKRASDIHIESMEKTMRLRYRMDGVLVEFPSPPKSLQAAIISRIKIMGNLDIAERRIPQDGRFKIRAVGKECDIRVSVLPTVHGEKVVMRILDKSALAPSIANLGLDALAYDNFMYALRQPHGMILVTGPTGSGKTTTLYSALQEVNTPDTNIITVEDPVEYQLHGINQVPVNAEVGLNFAAALRSILRQDPDTVMVGEIRDSETSSIAVQAALTGHRVLSTLHTNDAAGAIARMVYMGIESFLLASSLNMTQAQRLYRKLCQACKRPREVPQETLINNGLDPDKYQDIEFYEAKGCPKCGDVGYRGRGALMEVLLVNEAIRELILREADSAEIALQAVANGMMTLRDTGMARVREGTTTVEEIIRVTSGH